MKCKNCLEALDSHNFSGKYKTVAELGYCTIDCLHQYMIESDEVLDDLYVSTHPVFVDKIKGPYLEEKHLPKHTVVRLHMINNSVLVKTKHEVYKIDKLDFLIAFKNLSDIINS